MASTLMSTVGGAAGPLYGTAFLRAAKAADAEELDAADVAALLEGALEGVVARGKAVSASSYIEAKQAQQALIREFASLMAPFDVALTAPALGEAPAGLDATGDALFCTPFTLVGAPAISLPAGKSLKGLPLGIQLVGCWGEDAKLLPTAAWVEIQLDRGRNFEFAQYP